MANFHVNKKGKKYFFHQGNSKNAKAMYFSSNEMSKDGKTAVEIPTTITDKEGKTWNVIINENPRTGLPMIGTDKPKVAKA